MSDLPEPGARRHHEGPEEFDPVSVTIACEGEQHEVAWNHEGLHLTHHDFEAERAQEVLGGRTPECVALKRAWKQSSPIRFSNEQLAAIVAPEALSAISSGYTGKSQLDHLLAVHRHRSKGGVRKLVALSKDYFPDQEELPSGTYLDELEVRSGDFVRLALLPEPLRRRYGATALTVLEAAWAGSEPNDLVGSQPEWILRLTASYAYDQVKAFWEVRHKIPLPVIDWGVGRSEEEPLLKFSRGEGAASMQLPLDWLRTVWLQGAAWVDGLFVVKSVPVSKDQRRAVCVKWTFPRRKGPVPELREATLSRLSEHSWVAEE